MVITNTKEELCFGCPASLHRYIYWSIMIGGLSDIYRILAPLGGRRPPRAALLTSASLVALGVFSAPAEASCSQSNQTISSPTTSTKQSNGGNITITSAGSITANLGIILLSTPTGCSAGTINNAGSINYSTYGVFNQNSVTALTNSGTIAGRTATRNGGAGIISAGTIQTLTNTHTLSGGAASNSSMGFASGGQGVSNSNTIGTLTNSGMIQGGAGTGNLQAAGGTGMSNGTEATITSLTNNKAATIRGGKATGGASALGGFGIVNAHTIGTLTNSGTISGGVASSSGRSAVAVGGDGIGSSGTIATLINSGAVTGGTASSAATSAGASTKAKAGDGVSNSGAIGTLTNSGAINGGAAVGNGGLTRGGGGVSNGAEATITSLTNNAAATIRGGKANGAAGALGGAGVGNSGTIGTLTNNGTINGGDAVGTGQSGHAGAGGYGVLNGFASGATIRNLTNSASGTIQGGNGTNYGEVAGGTGLANNGTITTLSNKGLISGGEGNSTAADGWGALGIANEKAIVTLSNSGTIAGGNATGATAAFGGTGIGNVGTIGTLSNSGTIQAGSAGGSGAAAIGSAGGGLGTIANSGSIIGDIYIKNQSLTMTGGAATTFGNLTGLSSSVGLIDIENGNLTFADGATWLNDSIAVNGGKGTVYNQGTLEVAAPLTITGGFDQAGAGELDLDFAGLSWGEYGSLYVSGGLTLNGELNLDATGGFAFAAGQAFDILGFKGNALTGNFDSLLLDGQACTSTIADSWTCGTAVFNEVIDQSTGWIALDVTVSNLALPGVTVSALGIDPPASLYGLEVNKAVPEPSTWALIATGFLGFGGLGIRRRKRSVAA